MTREAKISQLHRSIIDKDDELDWSRQARLDTESRALAAEDRVNHTLAQSADAHKRYDDFVAQRGQDIARLDLRHKGGPGGDPLGLYRRKKFER